MTLDTIKKRYQHVHETNVSFMVNTSQQIKDIETLIQALERAMEGVQAISQHQARVGGELAVLSTTKTMADHILSDIQKLLGGEK